MSSLDPSRPWEWGTGAVAQEDEVRRMLETGETAHLVVPEIGGVEVRLDGVTGELRVLLQLPEEARGEAMVELLCAGARTVVFHLAGLQRKVRVGLAGRAGLRRGLEVCHQPGQGVLRLYDGGRSRELDL